MNKKYIFFTLLLLLGLGLRIFYNTTIPYKDSDLFFIDIAKESHSLKELNTNHLQPASNQPILPILLVYLTKFFFHNQDLSNAFLTKLPLLFLFIGCFFYVFYFCRRMKFDYALIFILLFIYALCPFSIEYFGHLRYYGVFNAFCTLVYLSYFLLLKDQKMIDAVCYVIFSLLATLSSFIGLSNLLLLNIFGIFLLFFNHKNFSVKKFIFSNLAIAVVLAISHGQQIINVVLTKKWLLEQFPNGNLPFIQNLARIVSSQYLGLYFNFDLFFQNFFLFYSLLFLFAITIAVPLFFFIKFIFSKKNIFYIYIFLLPLLFILFNHFSYNKIGRFRIEYLGHLNIFFLFILTFGIYKIYQIKKWIVFTVFIPVLFLICINNLMNEYLLSKYELNFIPYIQKLYEQNKSHVKIFINDFTPRRFYYFKKSNIPFDNIGRLNKEELVNQLTDPQNKSYTKILITSKPGFIGHIDLNKCFSKENAEEFIKTYQYIDDAIIELSKNKYLEPPVLLRHISMPKNIGDQLDIYMINNKNLTQKKR